MKLKFRGNFNALYSRSKASQSKLVSVGLLKSFCLPIVLYGLEVTDPKKSSFAMLNSLVNRAVYKIYSVSDTNVIQDIRNNLGLHNIELLCKERQSKFLRKTHVLTHAVLNSLTMHFITFFVVLSMRGCRLVGLVVRFSVMYCCVLPIWRIKIFIKGTICKTFPPPVHLMPPLCRFPWNFVTAVGIKETRITRR